MTTLQQLKDKKFPLETKYDAEDDVKKIQKHAATKKAKEAPEKTNLEKAILSNDSALKQVNSELAQVQARLVKAEEALEEALAGYDQSLENLAAVQQNIIQEQTKLGKIKKTFCH